MQGSPGTASSREPAARPEPSARLHVAINDSAVANQSVRQRVLNRLFPSSSTRVAASSDAPAEEKSPRDGANPPCKGDCEAAQAGWARASYDWARSEQRFVGLAPWYWEQPGAPPPSSWPPGHSDVPGLRWLTRELRPLYEEIGHEIVSGRQGDLARRG